MRKAIFALLTAAVMTGTTQAQAQLDRITSGQAASALRTALDKGSRAAVDALGRPDGFLGNAHVKIPLPPSLERAERLLRRLGMGRQADELVVAMNRAAEAAVPQARPLFVDAVRRMTVQDARVILQGEETAGTAYFRTRTEAGLRQRFLPVVRQATAKVDLARHYNAYAEKAAAFGLIREADADLDDYVTRKALDGLFLVLADEERKIRRDPAGAGSAIIRKVFGALKP